jgi:hypothetical protein
MGQNEGTGKMQGRDVGEATASKMRVKLTSYPFNHGTTCTPHLTESPKVSKLMFASLNETVLQKKQ